jgi:hypothetical protein
MLPVSVPARVRTILAAQRRAGIPFQTAWPAALDAVLEDEGASEQKRWRAVLTDTRDFWEAAYAGARATDLDPLDRLRWRGEPLAA